MNTDNKPLLGVIWEAAETLRVAARRLDYLANQADQHEEQNYLIAVEAMNICADIVGNLRLSRLVIHGRN